MEKQKSSEDLVEKMEKLGKPSDHFIEAVKGDLSLISPEQSIHRVIEVLVKRGIEEHVGIDALKSLFRTHEHILVQQLRADLASVIAAHFPPPEKMEQYIPLDVLRRVVEHLTLYFFEHRESGAFFDSLKELTSTAIPAERDMIACLFYSEKFFNFIAQLFADFVADLIDASFRRAVREPSARTAYFVHFAQRIAASGLNQQDQLLYWEHLFFDAISHGIPMSETLELAREGIAIKEGPEDLIAVVREQFGKMDDRQREAFDIFLAAAARRAAARAEASDAYGEQVAQLIESEGEERARVVRDLTPKTIPHFFRHLPAVKRDVAVGFIRESCAGYFAEKGEKESNRIFYNDAAGRAPNLSYEVLSAALL